MGLSRALAGLLALGAVAFVAAGCAAPRSQLGRLIVADASPQKLPVCHGYGCKLRTTVALRDSEWAAVTALFATPSDSAAAERERIALAIGRIERLVGPKAGTSGDHGENGFALSGGELDCVDEATNTTTYLRLLAEAHLLRWHDVAAPAARGRFFNGWPHNTAVVAERAGPGRYAIDSWYFDNGRPAAVVPLQAWLAGWHPTESDFRRADTLAADDALGEAADLQAAEINDPHARGIPHHAVPSHGAR
jgi:hypothetical protein